jgi:hypothetical protein
MVTLIPPSAELVSAIIDAASNHESFSSIVNELRRKSRFYFPTIRIRLRPLYRTKDS